jgi:hypothetical protein
MELAFLWHWRLGMPDHIVAGLLQSVHAIGVQLSGQTLRVRAHTKQKLIYCHHIRGHAAVKQS